MNNETIGPTFRKLVQTREYSLQVPGQTATIMLRTSNELLAQYEWIVGVKTGETPLAKSCLVAAGTKEGTTMLSVVLGQPDHPTCFTESLDLLEYGFSQQHFLTVLDAGVPVAEAVMPYDEPPLQLVTKDKVGS